MDSSIRVKALQTDESYIVQAPAGSGKTTLLIQRYLSLLAETDATPSTVLAVTFTRKAASEMQLRIMTALRSALQPAPTEEYKKLTYSIARKVLARDTAEKWGLLSNPSSLRITTIDGFVQSILKQMPLTYGEVSGSSLVDDLDAFYREVVDDFLHQYYDGVAECAGLQALFALYNNNYETVVDLLVGLLYSRDQWAHIVLDIKSNGYNAIVGAFNDILDYSKGIMHDKLSCIEGWQELSKYLSNNLSPDDSEELGCKALANIFLTDGLSFRKRLTKKEGFPSAADFKSKEDKEKAKLLKEKMLCAMLYLQEDSNFINAVISAKYLDDSLFDTGTIESLCSVLPYLLASFNHYSLERGKIDYISSILSAIDSVQDDEDVNIEKYVELRIDHLLIDEFQDTSYSQFKFLEVVSRNMVSQHNATYFLVGDPLQSIYRFRGADVSLFQQVVDYGFNGNRLEHLQLNSNYRSSSELVSKYNTIFNALFPKQNDINYGQFTYVPSDAKGPNANKGSQCYLHQYPSPEEEALGVCNQIEGVLKNDPTGSIAVLIQNRSQVNRLTQAFRSRGIPFIGVDLESLDVKMAIKDFLSLYNALTDKADTLSWCALLRSPFIGLSYQALEAILHGGPYNPIADHIYATAQEKPDMFSKRQLEVLQLLKRWQENRYRYQEQKWLSKIWDYIGGAALYPDERDAINKTLDILIGKTLLAHPPSPVEVMEALKKQYATTKQVAPNLVQIMTIHKAKGLEFDSVIIPFSDRQAKGVSPQAIIWDSFTIDDQKYWLAASKSPNEKNAPGYMKFIKHINQKKSEYERLRLLYVALTRAKSNLFITGVMQEKKNSGNSYFDLLSDFLPISTCESHESIDISLKNNKNTRINSSLPSEAEHYINLPSSDFIDSENQQWLEDFQKAEGLTAGRHQAIVGNIVHRLYQILCLDHTIQDISPDTLAFYMRQYGVSSLSWEQDAADISLMVQRFIKGKVGRWIRYQSQESHCEWVLPYRRGKFIQEVVIDRAFVENNTIWIIDYKTGDISDAHLKTYQSQLLNYRKILRAYDSRTIKLALYHPDIKGQEQLTLVEDASVLV